MNKTRIALWAAFLVSLTFSVPLQAKTLKLQSSSKAGDWAHRFMTETWAPKIDAITSGELKLSVLPTKAVVPHRETIDAVANGILDGDLNAVVYFAERDPAFALMGDLIAGYDTVEQAQTFCQHGGGKEILQKLYDKYTNGKVHVIGCGPYSREALVAKKPIRSVADLNGIKIRAAEGLASDVLRRVGATPVALPFTEVFPALEKGLIDAADASAYVNNDASGLHKIAKYPIYPGIHSMAVLQFILNKDVWDKLSSSHQQALEVWYIAASASMRRMAELEDKRLVTEHSAGSDITVVNWPQAERDKLRIIAMDAWAELAKKSRLAQQALDANLKFMKRYGLLDGKP